MKAGCTCEAGGKGEHERGWLSPNYRRHACCSWNWARDTREEGEKQSHHLTLPHVRFSSGWVAVDFGVGVGSIDQE
jgi:hypothetical protein